MVEPLQHGRKSPRNKEISDLLNETWANQMITESKNL